MRKAHSALLAVTTLILLAAPASAQEYPPTPEPLQVTTSTVEPGGTTTISGSGCTAGDEVALALADTAVGSTTADADGNFTLVVTVPSTTEPGTYALTASCGGVEVGVATITVAAEAAPGLPFTGSNAGPGLAVGIGLILAGALLLVSIRRRRSTQQPT